MSTTTANFSHFEKRPFSSKLASLLRVLADRFDAKTVEKTRAKNKRAIESMANSYQASQPNLASELRFIAWMA
ncbi:MAG: hypothetical protein JWQ10_2654 [Herbaspirillum sp.]|jgi:hypothetical protein|nr:hypothetical protein [Herbaspirillum sp.]